MLCIGKNLYSFDIFEEHFCCDLEKCFGACCVLGDSGAPIDSDEVKILDEIFPHIKSFLRPESVKYIELVGKYVTDSDNEIVTPLLQGKECVYAVFENEIAMCGIEKAFHAGLIDFRKPISCHLYPIRKTNYKDFTAINYHRWAICKSAVVKGKNLDIPVFRFCKDALNRFKGTLEYNELEIANIQINQRPK